MQLSVLRLFVVVVLLLVLASCVVFVRSIGAAQDTTDDNFTMVFMSDPQIYWGCQPNSTSNYCIVAGNPAKPVKTQGTETNQYHVTSIKALASSANTINFKGVVINGDLTDFGNQNKHWSKFVEFLIRTT